MSVGASRGEVTEGTRGSARIFWQRAFVLDGGSKERGERAGFLAVGLVSTTSEAQEWRWPCAGGRRTRVAVG